MSFQDSLEGKKKEWTKQLYQEHGAICYAYGIKLHLPLIVIMDFHSRWGHWDPLTRTLALSTQLIRKYPWGTVLEVLKHEIAHQVVSELWRQEEQHGPFFKRACECLGVEAWARRAEIHTVPDLASLQHREVSEKESQLLRRVEKLLALAQSPNEHEALAAMKKVSELYDTYQLENIEKQVEDEFASITIDHKLKRLPYFHAQIASILTGYFNVKAIFSAQYDPQDIAVYKTIELLGRPENVKLAEYVYWFLFNNLKLLWETYQISSKQRGLVAKHSYYSGILSGFEEKLRLQKMERRPSVSSKSLMTQEHRHLEQYLALKFPRMTSVSRGNRRAQRSAFEDGVRKGQELVLHKGMNSSTNGSFRLLD
ncbi:MAG: DUF2786 domain-containing protein [Deltaproteobacteria bacterium]|nr:DUF2786 domain-containing protein [Deltaproteobacteria bacterium]